MAAAAPGGAAPAPALPTLDGFPVRDIVTGVAYWVTLPELF